ncbi:unnamed protein product [Umbelopsis vinacea]
MKLRITDQLMFTVDSTRKQAMESLQGWEILDDIDSDFAEILDSADHTGEDKRALCEKFETASHERANQLLDSTASEPNESASFLYNESRTWKLISALFKNVHHTEHIAIQEHSAVLRWLQDTAPELPPVSYSKGEWRHAGISTFEERSRKVGNNMKITTMMDIDDDGPYRRKRRVQHQNSDFSRKMTKSLFNFVRRGQIKDAIKMCELCDEPWQSAGLYGYLEHNKGLKDESGILHLKDLTSTEATARNLWRISCNQIARDSTADMYERATYAALCGDVEDTLPACSSWEDVVWAYYNAMVENMLHEMLTPNHASTNGIPPEEAIFSSAQRKDVGADIPTRLFHYIQAMIITNRIDDLIHTLHDALVLKKTANELKLPVDSDLRPHLLRFATLAILYLNSISAYTANSQSDAIICEYIKLHAQFDGGLKAQLVALYCSKLSNVNQQVDMYSIYLMHSPTISKVSMLSEPVSPDTLRQIRGLEWLTLDQKLYPQAIVQSNEMIRYFLAQGNISAAQTTFAYLPSSVISSILTGQVQDVSDLTQIVSEMKLHDALIESWSLFSLWDNLHAKRPTADNLEKSLDISEMVARNDLRIHVEFVRAQRMGELVQRIQQSSVKILQLSQRD